MDMLSFGAGQNSTAMVIFMVNRGWRGHIVFADTSCEHPETYCYMRMFEAEWLRPRGLEITVLKGMPWHREWGGQSLVDYCERLAFIPGSFGAFSPLTLSNSDSMCLLPFSAGTGSPFENRYLKLVPYADGDSSVGT